MQLTNLLKSAKKYLATEFVEEGAGGISKYVCFAVGEACRAEYGGNWLDSRPAREYVQNKLESLQESLEVEDSACFNVELAAKYLKSIGAAKSGDVLQQARHLWLDSLIQELENGTN